MVASNAEMRKRI